MSGSASPDHQLRRRRTLRGRVSLLGLGVIAPWLLVLTVALNTVLSSRLDREVDVVLRARAAAAAATVYVAGDGTVSVREQRNDAALGAGIWIYLRGRVEERPRTTAALQSFVDSLVGGPSQYADHDANRFLSVPIVRSGARVGDAVASVSTIPYTRARSETLVGSIVVALLVLVGAYPVLRLAAARALRPVDEMARQAGDWSAHAPDERFGSDQKFVEMQTLARTLDEVLDRISAVVRHERRLSAELSHELRTPLTRIVAETDLLLAREHSRAQLAAAHEAIRESALGMERILETLLTAARVDARPELGTCEIRDVIDALVASSDASPRIDVDVPAELAVGVDHAVAERIIAPLLDNACRYAHSVVRLRASRTSDSVLLDIDDDGPGVPESARDLVFEPGRRGDPDDGHAGAGLGLALARRLARSAGGDVTHTGTGSVFQIRLPPA